MLTTRMDESIAQLPCMHSWRSQEKNYLTLNLPNKVLQACITITFTRRILWNHASRPGFWCRLVKRWLAMLLCIHYQSLLLLSIRFKHQYVHIRRNLVPFTTKKVKFSPSLNIPSHRKHRLIFVANPMGLGCNTLSILGGRIIYRQGNNALLIALSSMPYLRTSRRRWVFWSWVSIRFLPPQEA
jgi:hypothetical protein